MSVSPDPIATVAGGATPEIIPTGHPRGLQVIFMTEMWERFSYYGMRALLIGYMVQHHGWLPGDASTVYKWYTSLVYLTPLLGGLLADRFLGLRTSIIVGASLMAVGHFLMFFEPLWVFYLALGCLIAGNGCFKPNMATLVGRMYFKNDSRRDSAFTIFYMGINLGAFLSPLVCGYLRETFGYHWGFSAAGVGMTVGLAWFLLQQGQIRRDVEAAGNSMDIDRRTAKGDSTQAADADESNPRITGIPGLITSLFPALFGTLGVALPGFYFYQLSQGEAQRADLIMPVVYGAVFIWMSVTLLTIRGVARDKSTCIFLFFIFAVLFWMAFEQAGNALSLWALYNTRLSCFGLFSYPAEWWQSINAVMIVAIAPLASRLWQTLGPREPSTAMKMLLALGFMSAAFAVMVVAAKLEDQTTTSVECAAIPAAYSVLKDASGLRDGSLLLVKPADPKAKPKTKPEDAGRLRWDASQKQLVKQGVLGEYLVLNMLYQTLPASWDDEILGPKLADGSRKGSLEDLAAKATPESPVSKAFTAAPTGFKLLLEGDALKDAGIRWDESAKTMTFTKKPDAPTLNRIRASGGDPVLRDALWELKEKSVAARVSGIWLFLEYLLATLGELCLSPVGLSMVTKLAPLRFASLFMGVWHLSSSVAQYAGGSVGETWGVISPTEYFNFFVLTSLAGFGVLLLLVYPIKKMMHDVR